MTGRCRHVVAEVMVDSFPVVTGDLANLVQVKWQSAELPPRSPLAGWECDGSEGVLTLPCLGVARLSADGIVLDVPDESAAAALWARIGDWASAQVLQARGIVVFRGAAIARDEQVVVIAGTPRCGASMSALIATRRGWGLVADGYVAIDAERRILNRSDCVVVDSHTLTQLPQDVPRRDLPTKRPRTAVTVETHEGGTMTDVILFSRMQGLPTITITTPERGGLLEKLLNNVTFDRSLPATAPAPSSVIEGLPDSRIIKLVRPLTIRPDHGPECTPPGIAAAMIRHLDDARAAT